MTFRIPDFPLGALFASIMATIAILLAFPDLADDWMWWALVFVGCIAWAIGAGLSDTHTSPSESKPETTESGSDVQYEYDKSIISADAAAIVDAINRQERANRAQEKGEDHRKRTRELITIFIVAITGGAIILQVSELKRVYGPIHDQAVASKNQAQAALDQAGAAKIQADIAKDSAQTARDTMIAEHRAWVAPIKFTFANLNDPAEPLKVRIIYQNVGREPEKYLRNSWTLGYLRAPEFPVSRWGELPIWNSNPIFSPAKICEQVPTSG